MKADAKWKLKDAREHFDEVIDDALKHGPQMIEVDDGRMVTVTSQERRPPKARKHLLDFFRSAPLEGEDLEIERIKLEMRDLNLDD